MIESLGDQIANLTLIQAVELGRYLEEVHGIKSSKGVPHVDLEKPPKKEELKIEQTEFDLILDGFEPEKKLAVIKVYREISAVGIKEAKDFIEGGVGKALKTAMLKADAELLKVKFEAAGAKVSIK